MAQTLKFGKGTWATKTGSSMAYNDQNGNYKPLPFNVERDSIATRVNKEGLIEVVGKDKLRIDYTDSAKGVALLENSSTNLVSYSEDFSQSSWIKGGSSVVGGFTSPDGTNNAYKLVEDTSNAKHRVFLNEVGTSKTFSFFAKSDGRDWVSVLSNNGNSSFFDVANGVVGTVADGSIGEIEPIGNNGWYRCTLYNSHGTFGSYVGLATSDNSETYQGDGTSGAYIWGAQLEQGSYPTSYIPTSGSTYQRQADVVNGSGNSEVFNDSEGVLFADVSGLADDGTVRYIAVSNGSNNERVQIIYNSIANNIAMSVVSSNSGQASATAIGSQIQYSKLAIRYKTNDCSFWFNGFKINSDTSAVMPSGLDTLGFERPTGVSQFYGKTKELGYYDATLTDSELEYLTSYRSLNELVTELNLNTL